MIKFAAVVAFAIVATTLAADGPQTDWPSYNRTLTSERYASLDQINRANVSKLKQLCVYDLRIDSSFQTGPIVIGRTMYATTDKEILAIDAATCQLKWRVQEEGPSIGLRVNRGAAYLDGQLFRGTTDGNVLAYDAATGKKLWSTRIAYQDKGESIPSAPIAWNGLVFIGTAGSERHGVLGRMYALDATTGKVAWETYTVPTEAPQPGNEKMQQQAKATWGNASDVPITGGGTWSTYTLDAERGLLYVPVGNPGPDFANAVRPGSNLYTNSILILDAKTGIYRNHYSLVPADFHDWDLAAAPVLVTTKGGKRVVAGAPKDGLLHVYDLATDKKLYATAITTRENEDVPLSTSAHALLPGSRRWHRMERSCLQSRHQHVLQRHRRLVRDRDARSGRARKEARPDMDGHGAGRPIRQTRSRLGRMGHRDRCRRRTGQMEVQGSRAGVVGNHAHEGRPGVCRRHGQTRVRVRRE